MSAVAKIDTLQDDRGLQTCFKSANVEQDFVRTHSISTSDDFVYLVDSKEWEASLKDLLSGVASLKELPFGPCPLQGGI